MASQLSTYLFVFVLGTFIGLDVIKRVSPLLHTPLMSLTNAIAAIAVVGAILLAGRTGSKVATVLGTAAIVASMANVVGGFWITDRMLKMFKTKAAPAKSEAKSAVESAEGGAK